MIEYFALTLGHGLLVIGLLRLVMRNDLDFDPIFERAKQAKRARRKARRNAGRGADQQDGPGA